MVDALTLWQEHHFVEARLVFAQIHPFTSVLNQY